MTSVKPIVRDRPRPRHALAALAGFAALIATAGAGPIDPPPGPVAPTGPTLIFSLPTIIEQPGSYMLGRNLTSTGGAGISIAASNVTLDLGGHTLSGAGGGTDAIVLVGNLTNVTVRNGQIVNWTGAGVWDGATPDSNVRVERIAVTGTGFGGIECVESGVVIDSCMIRGGSPGVAVGPASIIRDTRITGAADFGIVAAQRVAISGCTIENAGFTGVLAGANMSITGTTVTGSGGDGVVVGAGSIVRGSVITLNGGVGAATSIAERFTATSARTGRDMLRHPFADRPATRVEKRTGAVEQDAAYALLTAEGVTVTIGLVLAEDCRVENSMITGNAGVGVLLGARSTALETTSDLNFGDGFFVTEDGVVERCRASANGGAGIVLTPSGSHCVGNYVSENALDGIFVADPYATVLQNKLELDELTNDAQAPLVAPVNDLTNPWSNFAT